MSKRCAQIHAVLHPTITRELRRLRAVEGRALSVLDVGCWDGRTTQDYHQALGGRSRGIEVFREEAERARSRGVEVAELDLETDRFPWRDGDVDVAVANQVFEHLKNVWLPMTEIARVIRPGGYLVFSVPNLASLHSRLMLLLGLQPSSIRTFGPHVRAYTYRQARQFVEHDGYFRITRAVGVGFYPLPARLAVPVANTWIGGCHTPVLIAQRIAGPGVTPPWQRYFAPDHGEQTHYSATARR